MEPDLTLKTPLHVFLQTEAIMRMCYSFVCAARSVFPNISVERAIDYFYDYYKVDEAVFIKKKSAAREYYRIDGLLRGAMKSQP